MRVSTSASALIVIGLTASLSACEEPPKPVVAPAPVSHANLQSTAGIQDIMAYMIDPAADFLWESVSTTVNDKGTQEHQPRTDAEWNEVRKHAIILTEAANLILMDGRHVAREGKQLEDHGTAGNLTAAESDAAIAADRATFESFAQALRDVGKQMLAAADNREPQKIIDAGDTMDQVCEGCHLKFWYPGQKIPLFPDQAPELRN
jgi:hypothetical protein